MGISRVLTIDGGGVRGVVPTIVLQRLCRKPGLDGFLGRVDFVAGTWTGALRAHW
jgi:patatin-like phospholipase/acyl hydrolase